MRFRALDSWRGIAALLVVLLHSRFLGHGYDLAFVRNSWLFVDFFFVLSGFVLAHAYGERLVAGYDRVAFVIRRFGRLWPLHAAVLVAFVVAEIGKLALDQSGVFTPETGAFDPTEKYAPLALVSNVLLLQSLGLHDKLTWNEPSWSISTEFYTYIVFAAFCFLKHPKVRLLVAGLLVGGSLVIVSRSGSFMNTTFDYGFFRCVAGFFMGYFCYQAYAAASRSEWRPSTILELVALGLVVAFVTFAGRGYPTLAAPAVFASVVWVYAFEGGRASQFLLTRPLQRLGEWSYSIYMVHALIVMVVSRGITLAEKATDQSLRVFHTPPGEVVPVELISFGNAYLMDGLTMLYVLAVVATAALTYRFIEVPGRDYFNAVASRRSGSE